jgi:hypothetical protein
MSTDGMWDGGAIPAKTPTELMYRAAISTFPPGYAVGETLSNLDLSSCR